MGRHDVTADRELLGALHAELSKLGDGYTLVSSGDYMNISAKYAVRVTVTTKPSGDSQIFWVRNCAKVAGVRSIDLDIPAGDVVAAARRIHKRYQLFCRRVNTSVATRKEERERGREKKRQKNALRARFEQSRGSGHPLVCAMPDYDLPAGTMHLHVTFRREMSPEVAGKIARAIDLAVGKTTDGRGGPCSECKQEDGGTCSLCGLPFGDGEPRARLLEDSGVVAHVICAERDGKISPRVEVKRGT